jgi:hypothetical protein
LHRDKAERSPSRWGRPAGTEPMKQFRRPDPLDFWRVEEVSRGKRLCLKAMMKVPGEAYLVFETIPVGAGKTRLRSSALFRPRGLMGRIYWWQLLPIHQFIFSGMNAAIREQAAARTNDVTSTPAATGSTA